MPKGMLTDRDYLFLDAMIKLRASSLLSFEKLCQMAASGSSETARQILADAGWPKMAGMSVPEIDAVLTRRREQLYDDITRDIPEDEVIGLLRLKYDYHNAKVIIKSEASGMKGEALLSDVGSVSPKMLKSAFEESDYRAVPSTLGKAMDEAKSVLARTQNPQLADFVLDRAYFEEMRELAEAVEADPRQLTPLLDSEAQGRFPLRYRALLIDCANLRTCVRCVRMGKDADFMAGALIPGGSVSVDNLVRAALSGDGLANAFFASPLAQAAALGASVMKGGEMTRFEKECEDSIMRYLANLRLTEFGPVLVVWYLTVEETNLINVRMILTGLQAGVSPEKLKERLRETYV